MIPRMIPTVLASIGFLVTFTIRSWQEGRWPLGGAADYAIVGTLRDPAAARRVSITAPPLGSASPHEAVLPRETVQSHGAPTPAAESMVAPVAGADYLGERTREASHSGRMR